MEPTMETPSKLEEQGKRIKELCTDVKQSAAGYVFPMGDPCPIRTSITWSVTKLAFAYAKYAYLWIGNVCGLSKPEQKADPKKE
jgi:hypothetical protein